MDNWVVSGLKKKLKNLKKKDEKRLIGLRYKQENFCLLANSVTMLFPLVLV